MPDLLVHPQSTPLVGSVPVPSDPRIHALALVLAALATGVSRLRGDRAGEEALVVARALQALGVRVSPSPLETEVAGVGLFGLTPPDAALDCGSGGGVAALLAGLVSAQPFVTTLLLGRGDDAAKLVAPLLARGALVQEAHEGGRPSLRVGPLPPADKLAALSYASPGGEPQVKAALLLSGLFAHGATYFREPTLSLDHAERLLQAVGGPLATSGPVLRLDPANWSGELAPFDLELPGDLSAAAFLLIVAQLVPGSRVTARAVGVNPTRAGVLEVLRDSGAGLGVEPGGERLGEPVADLHAWQGTVRPFRVGGEASARATDDLFALAVLASFADGESRIEVEGAASQARLEAAAGLLSAFGVACVATRDGTTGTLAIEGACARLHEEPLASADLPSLGDPARVMAAALFGLRGNGPTRVRDIGCLGQRYPRFVGTLRALGAQVQVVESRASG